jgi:hypothetical protein
MRLVLGLLFYTAVVVALGSGAAAVLSSFKVYDAGHPTTWSEPTAIASPRIQAWLERKAEGVAFAEKEKAAAQAERERADALRAKLAATPDPVATRASNPSNVEERRGAERERTARARDGEKRERRRLRDPEAHAGAYGFAGAYGYASEPRRRSYPDQFMTMRDREPR